VTVKRDGEKTTSHSCRVKYKMTAPRRLPKVQPTHTHTHIEEKGNLEKSTFVSISHRMRNTAPE